MINNFKDLVKKITENVFNPLVGLLLTLALIYFFVGLVKYIMSAGDEEAKGAGRSIMINGVIALFVMVSVWGLVNVLKNTFQLPDTPVVPRPPATMTNPLPGLG